MRITIFFFLVQLQVHAYPHSSTPCLGQPYEYTQPQRQPHTQPSLMCIYKPNLIHCNFISSTSEVCIDIILRPSPISIPSPSFMLIPATDLCTFLVSCPSPTSAPCLLLNRSIFFGEEKHYFVLKDAPPIPAEATYTSSGTYVHPSFMHILVQ